MNRNSVSLSNRLINWIIRYNLPIIAFWAFLLCFFEVIEPLLKNEPLTDPFHVLEILFFLTLLILVRILINHLIMANASQKRTLEILNFKHDISLELAKVENWDVLRNELVRLPCRIAIVETSRLHILNSMSGKLELVAHWEEGGVNTSGFQTQCEQCLRMMLQEESPVRKCTTAVNAMPEKTSAEEYCIPLNYGNELLGLIQIRLAFGEKLSQDQLELFENIRDDVALILKINQEQSALTEMQLAKTALAERRTVSMFIHDQLGQNLGYLHLKLDQLIGNKIFSGNKEIQAELKRLCDVSNDSYNIVRDILKTIRSDTIPNLSNLLKEQSRTVSRRAKFELDFKTVGMPIPLLPALQQSIFFTFCEILSNVEKHSGASKVMVHVAWKDDMLNISVTDDGTGFEPAMVKDDERFGLHIMQERISSINGKLIINSSIGTGTTVSLSVPLQGIEKASR